MVAIVERCEDFMVSKVKAKPNDSILADLVIAQTYKLEKLKLASVQRSHSLRLGELKSDKTYEQIEPENLKEIMGGIIERLEKELQESQSVSTTRQMEVERMKLNQKGARDKGLKYVENIVRLLVNHAANKGIYTLVNCSETNGLLAALDRDRFGKSCTCSGLSNTVSD